MDKDIERRLIELAFEPFNRTGDWPTVRQVHLKAVREGLQVQAYEVFQFFYKYAGTPHDDSPTTLGVSSLVELPKAEWLLKQFVGVVQLAVNKFLEGSDDEPKISSKDVKDVLLLNDLQVRQLHALIDRSIFLIRGGTWNPDRTQWDCFIGPDIAFFRNIRNIHDYLSVVEQLRRPAAARLRGQAASPPEVGDSESKEEPRTGFKTAY